MLHPIEVRKAAEAWAYVMPNGHLRLNRVSADVESHFPYSLRRDFLWQCNTYFPRDPDAPYAEKCYHGENIIRNMALKVAEYYLLPYDLAHDKFQRMVRRPDVLRDGGTVTLNDFSWGAFRYFLSDRRSPSIPHLRRDLSESDYMQFGFHKLAMHVMMQHDVIRGILAQQRIAAAKGEGEANLGQLRINAADLLRAHAPDFFTGEFVRKPGYYFPNESNPLTLPGLEFAARNLSL